ncbi:MAG: hypothetical protein JWO67_7399 [Streptosporangiaceae bacterium]|nr:hypothetical protein [Streptosporangiaceae bacterium]
MVQSLPWASGKRKPLPRAKPKRKRRRRMSRKGMLTTIVWELSALCFLVVALMLQGILYALVAVLMALVGAIAAWADTAGEPAVPAPSRKPAKTANPRGSRRSAAVVTCTRTGKPTDVCGCPQKHVMTTNGERRYKKRIGDTYGSAKGGRKAKEPRVPMTKNAKPQRQVPGETMRRVV